MALEILDATTRANVYAATTQQAQAAALIAPWAAGDVTVRIMAGATLLTTRTHGPWVTDEAATPVTVDLDAAIARTGVASAAPTALVFRAGGVDIFSLTAAVAPGADMDFAGAVNVLSDEDLTVRLTAKATLPKAPPPTPTLTWGAPDTATAGVALTGTITASGAASGPWSLNVPSGWTVSPSSGSNVVPGSPVSVSITGTTGTQSLTLTCSGATITGNPQSIVVSAAPSAPTTLAITGSATGATGSPTTITGTLNAPATVAVTVTPTAATGATFSTPAVIAIGQTTTTWTVTRATDGTAAISATTSPSLTVTGGYTYTASTAAPTGTPGPFTLTSSTSGTLPYAIGYAARQGDIPAGTQPVLTGASGKGTCLSTWPDGSWRHGVIAGTYTSSGSPVTVTVAAGSNAAGTALTGASVQAAMGANTAVFDAGAFGTATFSGADFATPFHTHCATSAHGRFIYRKQIGSDAHLVAWMEVDVWASGAVQVLPWVENGYLTVAAPVNKSATYAFTLGGALKFSGAIDLPNHCRTPLLSGSALSWWLGSDPGVTARLDSAYLMDTGLVPTYGATVSNSASMVTGQPSTYTPLQLGGYPASMGTAGYHPSIGLLPEWDVLYLTTTASNIPAAVERQAFSAGQFGIHFRDESTNRPIVFSSYPTLVLGGGNEVGATGTSSASLYTPDATGTTPLHYASSHSPSMGFLAYLISGRFYHLETVQFLATVNYLKNSDTARRGEGTTSADGARGIFLSAAGANQTRGAAWSLRTLAQAAAISPDADPVGTSLRTSYAANIDWHHATYVAQANNPQGIVRPYTDYTQAVFATTGVSTGTSIVFPAGYVFETDGIYVGWSLKIGGETRTITAYVGATRTATVVVAFGVSTSIQPFVLSEDLTFFEAAWQQDFYTAAMGYGRALGVLGVDALKERMFFEWKAKSIVGRLGTEASTEYLYRDAATYILAVAPDDAANWVNGTGPWYSNFGQMYDATWASVSPGSRTPGILRGGNWPSATSYWGNLMPAISYAVQFGVTGAMAGWLRMTDAANFSEFDASAVDAPVWSVIPPNDPRRLGSLVPSAGSSTNINLNDVATIAEPAGWWSQATGMNAAFRNWNGGVYIPDYGKRGAMAYWGGGHSGGEDCGVKLFDFDLRKWSRIGPANPVAAYTGAGGSTDLRDADWNDYDHAGQKILAGLHTYAYPAFVPTGMPLGGSRGSWLLPHIVPENVRGAPHRVDLATGVGSRFTSNFVANRDSPYCGALQDTNRHIVWWGSSSDTSINKVDLKSASPSVSVVAFSAGWGGYYGTPVFAPDADMGIIFWTNYGESTIRGQILDLSSGTPVHVAVSPWALVGSGAPVVGGGGYGVDWNPITRAFYFYAGFGTTNVYKLKPSTLDFSTCTWTWSTETFATPAWEPHTSSGFGEVPYNRWRFVPAYRGFAWTDGQGYSAACVDGPTRGGIHQIWRPAGG